VEEPDRPATSRRPPPPDCQGRWCCSALAETTEQMLLAVAELSLVGTPGGQVLHSSQGFRLLGLIAESAAGTGVDALTGQRVLGPAGMAHTSFTTHFTAVAVWGVCWLLLGIAVTTSMST